jgi:N-acyl-D-amino-acid deacylase
MFDLLIKGGLILDGSGRPGFWADLGLQAGRIQAVGDLAGAPAGEVLEITGLAVAPGFIDLHSHADWTIALLPTADSLVHQGFTTVLMGQCGHSLAPLLPGTREEVIASLEPRRRPTPWERWSTFPSYLDFLDDLGPAVNLLPLVGQGTVRAGVMGFRSGPASAQELTAMVGLVEEALAAGAWGLSTGLIYPPGCYAGTAELIALARPVGRAGGLYCSHLRSEGRGFLEALAEAAAIGRASGARVQVSHLKASWPANWPKMAPALDFIDRVRAEGLDLWADAYPYLAGSTSLRSILPAWALEGGQEPALARLADPDCRARMAEDMIQGGFLQDGDWSRILLTKPWGRPDLSGRFVAEAAAGRPPVEFIFDLLRDCRLDAGMIVFIISEENLRAVLTHPAVLIGTDATVLPLAGRLAQGLPHPRTFGTTARLLGHYVREEKLLTLAEAVAKLTGRAAARLGLADRGLIEPGRVADLVVLDPQAIADQGDYQRPFRHPAGVSHVLVGGTPVLRQGRLTGARPGRVIRFIPSCGQ